jgi:hypothetical protein
LRSARILTIVNSNSASYRSVLTSADFLRDIVS